MKRRRGLRLLLAAALAVLLAETLFVGLIRPSNTRQWQEDHTRLPLASFDGDRVTIEGFRDFRYEGPTISRATWETRSFDLSRLESLWLTVAIFDEPRRRGPAHTMLSFGFTGGDYVVISVEARKEVGEGYSPYLGMLRKYELIYVIGDERDLIATRAVERGNDVYLYPIRAPREKIRELFVDMLQTANELRHRPRFYNTLTTNCTTRLCDHVNNIAPGRIPPSWRLVLPGYSDELVEGLGLLASDLSLEQSRDRYRINALARQYAEDEEFSRRIREALP